MWLEKLRNLQFCERRPWFGIMLMIYLVGVLRNEGKGRAVRYIRVINASNIVINVVKISVIPKNTPCEECCQEILFWFFKSFTH